MKKETKQVAGTTNYLYIFFLHEAVWGGGELQLPIATSIDTKALRTIRHISKYTGKNLSCLECEKNSRPDVIKIQERSSHDLQPTPTNRRHSSQHVPPSM